MNGLNFGQKVDERSSDILPKDTLGWAAINIREFKHSRETNGQYLDIELTLVDGQPNARRKIWIKLANPFDSNNSENWRTMGYGAIRRILEAVKGATPDNANSYTLNQLQDLHGLVVPIIVGIEKGQDGYDDKNNAEFLSPYSSVKKIVECYNLLKSGVYEYTKGEKKAHAPGQGSMFTGTHQAPPVAAPSSFTPPAAAPTASAPAPSFLAPAPTAPAAFPAGQMGSPIQAPMVAGPATHAPSPGIAPSIQPAPVAQPAQTSPSNPGNWAPPAQG